MAKKPSNPAEPQSPLPAGVAPSSDPVSAPPGDVDARASFKALPFETVDFAELSRLCRTEVSVDLPLGGRRIRVVGQSLNAAELAQIAAITISFLPPVVVSNTGEKEYDATNPKYLSDRDRLGRQQVALALVLGYPSIAARFAEARKLGLQALTDAIEEALSKDVIDLLHLRVTNAGRVDLGLIDFS